MFVSRFRKCCNKGQLTAGWQLLVPPCCGNTSSKLLAYSAHGPTTGAFKKAWQRPMSPWRGKCVHINVLELLTMWKVLPQNQHVLICMDNKGTGYVQGTAGAPGVLSAKTALLLTHAKKVSYCVAFSVASLLLRIQGDNKHPAT